MPFLLYGNLTEGPSQNRLTRLQQATFTMIRITILPESFSIVHSQTKAMELLLLLIHLKVLMRIN
jgi:hypothetical protein